MGLVQSLMHTYGYAALVLILFLDASGVPWPTEATLVAVGGMAATSELNIGLVWLSGLAGAAAGSTLSYFLGRRIGHSLMGRIAAFFRLAPEHLAKVDHWFNRHGHRAVFLGRLVPFVRNFTGYPAGAMAVPFGKYLLFSLAGYGLYTAFALSIGYGGSAFTRWVGDVEIVLWVAVPVALLVLWIKWGRKWVALRREKGKA